MLTGVEEALGKRVVLERGLTLQLVRMSDGLLQESGNKLV